MVINQFIYTGIIKSVDESNGFYEENDTFRNIHEIIQKKIDEFINQNNIVSSLIKLNDLELIMKENEIPIKAYVYDSYSKVIYIQTDNNVLIPVEHFRYEEYMNLIYFPSSLKGYPKYDDVINTFTMIDRTSW